MKAEEIFTKNIVFASLDRFVMKNIIYDHILCFKLKWCQISLRAFFSATLFFFLFHSLTHLCICVVSLQLETIPCLLNFKM